MNEDMTPDQFERVVLAQGPDRDLWSGPAAAAARRHLDETPGAHALLAEIAGLDMLAARSVQLGSDAALATRIIASVSGERAAFDLGLGRLLAYMAGSGGLVAAGYAAAAAAVTATGLDPTAIIDGGLAGLL